MTIHLTYTDPDAQSAIRLMRAAVPGYTGRTFKVRPQESVDVRSYWSGGSKDTFTFVHLASGQLSPQVPAQSAFNRPIAGADCVTLPEGVGCVEHSIFCGKDMGLTLIIPPGNAPRFLPEPTSATADELVVLEYTGQYKNTYSGRTNIRAREAIQDGKITQDRWIAAQATLVARKLLNKAVSLTAAGRNTSPNNW